MTSHGSLRGRTVRTVVRVLRAGYRQDMYGETDRRTRLDVIVRTRFADSRNVAALWDAVLRDPLLADRNVIEAYADADGTRDLRLGVTLDFADSDAAAVYFAEQLRPALDAVTLCSMSFSGGDPVALAHFPDPGDARRAMPVPIDAFVICAAEPVEA